MNLELAAVFSPVLSVALCVVVEKMLGSQRLELPKLASTAAMQLLNLAVSLALAAFVLLPLVLLFQPLQVFSLSSWEVPVWMSFLASLLLLDLVHYVSHWLHHRIPLLWRFHRLHHSDRQVNALTTFLHHPLEVVSTYVLIILAAVMFDVPVIALITYSVVVGLHSGFTHMNLQLPGKVDRVLRWILVTPNFHRTHHLLDMRHGNSNFGSLLGVWDHLFKTAAPAGLDLQHMAFGIDERQSPKSNAIHAYLINPVR